VVDDVSVQQVFNNNYQQQQQAAETTPTATNLTDCFKSFTQQERVSCARTLLYYQGKVLGLRKLTIN